MATVPAPSTEARYSDFQTVPRALVRALEAGDLDLYEFSVICGIALALDFRMGVLVTTLRGLADRLDWPHGVEHLRRHLDNARAKLWVDYESSPGKRTRYAIRLGPTWEKALLEGVSFVRPEDEEPF